MEPKIEHMYPENRQTKTPWKLEGSLEKCIEKLSQFEKCSNREPNERETPNITEKQILQSSRQNEYTIYARQFMKYAVLTAKKQNKTKHACSVGFLFGYWITEGSCIFNNKHTID